MTQFILHYLTHQGDPKTIACHYPLLFLFSVLVETSSDPFTSFSILFIPSLNERTPFPRPFISSGIFLRRDIKYRLYALVLTALEAVFIKKIIIMSDALTSFIFWCTSSAFFSFLFYTAGKNKIMPALNLSIKKYLGYFLLLGFSMFLMQFSTNIVFEHMNVSSALALFQLSSLVSVILGRQYFGEKNIGKKILGAIIMSAGAAVVILY